jgi:hypothetical protein
MNALDNTHCTLKRAKIWSYMDFANLKNKNKTLRTFEIYQPKSSIVSQTSQDQRATLTSNARQKVSFAHWPQLPE